MGCCKSTEASDTHDFITTATPKKFSNQVFIPDPSIKHQASALSPRSYLSTPLSLVALPDLSNDHSIASWKA